MKTEIICSVCKKQFLTQTLLTYHQKRVKKCKLKHDSNSSQSENSTSSSKTKSSEGCRSHTCKECGKDFTRKSSLHFHRKFSCIKTSTGESTIEKDRISQQSQEKLNSEINQNEAITDINQQFYNETFFQEKDRLDTFEEMNNFFDKVVKSMLSRN